MLREKMSNARASRHPRLQDDANFGEEGDLDNSISLPGVEYVFDSDDESTDSEPFLQNSFIKNELNVRTNSTLIFLH